MKYKEELELIKQLYLYTPSNEDNIHINEFKVKMKNILKRVNHMDKFEELTNIKYSSICGFYILKDPFKFEEGYPTKSIDYAIFLQVKALLDILFNKGYTLTDINRYHNRFGITDTSYIDVIDFEKRIKLLKAIYPIDNPFFKKYIKECESFLASNEYSWKYNDVVDEFILIKK